MSFELAYDLEIKVDREVVFVMTNDRHRKVRLLITEITETHDHIAFTGNSLGSSYPRIKAAKKDETPVVVKGDMKRSADHWSGQLTMVK